MPVLGKSKKEVVTEFRTAELLEAARRVFAEKGFHEATVDDVAEEAGVAKGTVYLYYRSKRDLYWAALKHGISSMHAETRRRMQQENTIEGKLHAFVDRHFVVRRGEGRRVRRRWERRNGTVVARCYMRLAPSSGARSAMRRP